MFYQAWGETAFWSWFVVLWLLVKWRTFSCRSVDLSFIPFTAMPFHVLYPFSKLDYWVFLLLSCRNFLICLNINVLLDVACKYFLLPHMWFECWWPFPLLCRNLLVWHNSTSLCLILLSKVSCLRNHCQGQCQETISLHFLLGIL